MSWHESVEGNSLELQLQGYRMATAEILYHMPDYPKVLQSFVWQNLDLAPKFPVLRKFLDFWDANLDGPIHSVIVGSTQIISPSDMRVAREFGIH